MNIKNNKIKLLLILILIGKISNPSDKGSIIGGQEVEKKEIAEINRENIQDTLKENTQDTPKENTQDTPKENTQNTPKANTQDAPKVNTQDAPKEKTQDAPKANTQDAPKEDTKGALSKFTENMISYFKEFKTKCNNTTTGSILWWSGMTTLTIGGCYGIYKLFKYLSSNQCNDDFEEDEDTDLDMQNN